MDLFIIINILVYITISLKISVIGQTELKPGGRRKPSGGFTG